MHKESTTTICPGCGFVLPDRQIDPRTSSMLPVNAGRSSRALCGYTVSKQAAKVNHPNVVDAYEAQHAGGRARNITGAFGLIGLYLALEKGYTGKQAHMQLARVRKD